MLRMIGLALIAMSSAGDLMAVEEGLDRSKLIAVPTKEPSYKEPARYALLVIGPKLEHRCWLVLDGIDLAYIDKNGNGDLTEDGERIELDKKASDAIKMGGSGSVEAMHVFPLGEVAGTVLTFQLWIRDPNYDPFKDESLNDYPEIRTYQQQLIDRRWLNGSLYRTAEGGMQAQIPLALTMTPAEAQVCSLLGPLTFALKWGSRQQIEAWPKRTTFDVHIGSPCLPPTGWTGPGFDFSPLTTSEVPENLYPVAKFQYPPDGVNAPSNSELTLKQRCCGDTFYDTFGVTKGITSGLAKVTVEMPVWIGLAVETKEFDVPINQTQSNLSDAGYVMFHDPDIDVRQAINILRKNNLDVQITENGLLLLGGETPVGIRLNREHEVNEVARGLAHNKSYADELSRCDARFEVGPYSSQNAKLIRNAMELLQSLTKGFTYQTWDASLSD